MKKLGLLLLSPLLSLVASVALLVFNGLLLYPVLLFRSLLIPILHALCIKHLRDKGSLQKKLHTAFAVFPMMGMILVDSFFFETVVFDGSFCFAAIAFRVAWALLCSLVLIGQPALHRILSRYKWGSAILIAQSLFALAIHAFLTYFASPVFTKAYRMDGAELLLLTVSFVFLAMCSAEVGYLATRKCLALKLGLWFFGILAATFVTFFLLGTPHTPPTSHTITLFGWIISSVLLFAFALFGHIGREYKD